MFCIYCRFSSWNRLFGQKPMILVLFAKIFCHNSRASALWILPNVPALESLSSFILSDMVVTKKKRIPPAKKTSHFFPNARYIACRRFICLFRQRGDFAWPQLKKPLRRNTEANAGAQHAENENTHTHAREHPRRRHVRPSYWATLIRLTLGTLAAIITIPRKRKQTVRRRKTGNNPPTSGALGISPHLFPQLRQLQCSAKRSSRPNGGGSGVRDSSCCVSVCVEGRKSSRHNFFFFSLPCCIFQLPLINATSLKWAY